MKKFLLSLTLVIALALPPAKANAFVCAPVLIAASAAAPLSATAWVGVLAPPVLFTLGALNVDPWTPVFGKDHVFQEYPAGANHVFTH